MSQTFDSDHAIIFLWLILTKHQGNYNFLHSYGLLNILPIKMSPELLEIRIIASLYHSSTQPDIKIILHLVYSFEISEIYIDA